MKKVFLIATLCLILLLANTGNWFLTNASATANSQPCAPTNPPQPESTCGGGWEFVGCYTDTKGQVFEVYYLENCKSSINRPAN